MTNFEMTDFVFVFLFNVDHFDKLRIHLWEDTCCALQHDGIKNKKCKQIEEINKSYTIIKTLIRIAKIKVLCDILGLYHLHVM